MNKGQALRLEPYTAFAPASLSDGPDLLENILSADLELHPRKVDKPVILYGAGDLGKMAKGFFDYLDMPFQYVVDEDAARLKADKGWQGINIIHPNAVNIKDKKNALLVICIVTTPLIALRDRLKSDGWEDVAFFYDVSEAYSGRHPMSNGWFLSKPSARDKELMIKAYFSLNDDISRMHYLQFLAWRRLRVEILSGDIEINAGNRFFIPEVASVLDEHEVFVDCGAHKGSVTKKFLEIVKNKYGDIYAIEPDRESFELCKSALKGIKDITMIRDALSDRNGEEKFYQGFDFASELNTSGNAKVKTTTLDSLHIPATFIKMHIEGGELGALKGAVATIQKYRPILALTIYHNSDGAWKIPLFLMENAKDYIYCVRSHSWGGTGAVLYAIPNERYKKRNN